MKHIGSADGDTAVAFLRQVAELIAIDNLPAPLTVTVYNRSVLVNSEDFAVWCRALCVDVPDFRPSRHDPEGPTRFAEVEVAGFFTLESNYRVGTAVAS